MFERITKTPLFNNNRLHLVHFGFDLDIFKPGDSSKAKQSLNIPDENIVISFRATEIVYKGLNSIRQCLRKLQSEYPITLLVFNERGLLDEFRDTFQIVELGWVTDDEIMIEAYNAADIFLMPSKAETFGMMAVEAMACGKPVIAMDGTSLPEVLKPDESGCIIVPQGDVDAMCSSLKLLLRDSDLRRKIGERSRTTAEKYYCKERYVNEIIEVYEKAIERKRGDKRAYQIIEQQKRNCLFKGHLSPEFSALINHDASNLPVNNVSSGEFKLIQLVRCIKKLPVIAQLWESIVRPAYNNIRDFRRKFQ
jgi:glycosyltransferase involved in cell wall biosynthesis